MKGDRRWKDEILTSKEQRKHQRKEDNQTGRKEKKATMQTHDTYSWLLFVDHYLLSPVRWCFSFHQVRFRPVKAKSEAGQRKRQKKKWSSGEWRLHHSDSLQTSVTYNLPWQSHINTKLCWQGNGLKQTKLPFETVTRMYRQKPLFSQEGWTFWSVSECLNRLFDLLSVWHLGLMLEKKLD